jgi:flagellar protein FlaG
MALEIGSAVEAALQLPEHLKPRPDAFAPEQEVHTPPPDVQTRAEIERTLKEIQHLSGIYNRRLRFSFNEKLNQMIVKVVDAETDRVIKELPPKEIQRVHMRIREVLGLLFDETI